MKSSKMSTRNGLNGEILLSPLPSSNSSSWADSFDIDPACRLEAIKEAYNGILAKEKKEGSKSEL
jgi:hypothetical protein